MEGGAAAPSGGAAPAPAPSGGEAPAANDNAAQAPANDNGAPPPQAAPSDYLTDDQLAAFKGKKWKQKIDGREEDVLFDEILEAGPRAKSIEVAARKRMEEAAKIRKNQERFVEDFQKDWFGTVARAFKHEGDPIALIEKTYGRDKARQVAEAYVARMIEEDALTPEEKQARQFSAEAQRLKQENQTLKQQMQQRQREEQRQAKIQEYGQSFPKALTAAGVKPGPRTIARMAAVAQAHVDAGQEWTPESVAKIVHGEIEAERGEHTSALVDQLLGAGEEKILEVLEKVSGPKAAELRKILRAAEVRAVKAQQAAPPPAQPARDPNTGQFTGNGQKKDPSNPNGYIRLEDLRREMFGD